MDINSWYIKVGVGYCTVGCTNMLDGRLDQCLWCKIGDNSVESTDVNSLVVAADDVGQNCNGITESSL